MSLNHKQIAPKPVWYASYGPNLKREHFMCDISGCTPEGSTNSYDSCRDKSQPIESCLRALNFEPYFARESENLWKRWPTVYS
jgi:hypothetical protein